MIIVANIVEIKQTNDEPLVATWVKLRGSALAHSTLSLNIMLSHSILVDPTSSRDVDHLCGDLVYAIVAQTAGLTLVLVCCDCAQSFRDEDVRQSTIF